MKYLHGILNTIEKFKNCHQNTKSTYVDVPEDTHHKSNKGYTKVNPDPQGYTTETVIKICALQ